MDLRGLGGGTWKGFSDRELSKLKQACESVPQDQPPSSPSPAANSDSQQCPTQIDTSTYSMEEVSCEPELKSCDLVEVGSTSRLEEQQRQQQDLEAENKRKKKVLEDMLVQRYQESQTESHKLERVRTELRRLDQLVTRDVTILRDKIEEATREYNSARTRFERAEREYVSAKLGLATSRERKELLSQHLCAVIQENEGRKASKLTELMSELNIQENH